MFNKRQRAPLTVLYGDDDDDKWIIFKQVEFNLPDDRLLSVHTTLQH